MSTEKTALQKPSARLPKSDVKAGHEPESKQPTIEKIEVSTLQIDEAFDGDHDPYNSTGQFLADALKKKYDE